MLVTVVVTFFFSFFNVALLAENLRSHSVSSGYMFRFLVTSESLASDNSGQWLPSPESHLLASLTSHLSLSLSLLVTMNISTASSSASTTQSSLSSSGPSWRPHHSDIIKRQSYKVIRVITVIMSHFSFQEALVSRVLRLLAASWLPRPLARHGQRSSKGGENILWNENVKIIFSIFLRELLTLFIPCPQKTPYKVKTQMFWIRCVYIRKLCGNLNAININSFNKF